MKKLHMKRQASIYLVLLSMLSAGLLSCADNSSAPREDSDGPIKIGVINSLSGPAAPAGQATQRGVDTAVDMINDDGGIDGRQIELIVKDDEGKPEVGARFVSEFASDPEVALILGPYLSPVLAAADPQARKEGIPLIAMSGAGYVPPEGEDMTWTTVPNITYKVTGAKFTEYAIERGWTKAASLNPTDLGGQIAEDMLDDVSEEYDMEIAVRERHDPDALDVTPQLNKLKAANPDVLYAYAVTEPASIVVRQAQQVGLEVPINVSHINASQVFLDLVEDVPNETVYVAGIRIYTWESLPDNSPQKKLFENFTTTYSEKFPDREAEYIEAIGGDVVSIAAAALRNAGSDREAIREYLSKGNQDITGMITPSYNFTEKDRLGYTDEGLVVLTNRNGKWVAAEE